MKVQRGGSLLERQLRAEVRRILLLLERTRRTRRQVRLLIAFAHRSLAAGIGHWIGRGATPVGLPARRLTARDATIEPCPLSPPPASAPPRSRIRPLAKRTPVLTSSEFDAAAGARVFFKCENLQTGGAFKIRGASNLILSIPAADLPRGVVAFSSGNHAIAVAIAARHAGAAATIVMPADAPRSKLETARAHGARIVTVRSPPGKPRGHRRPHSRRSGATLVPPFDHPMIMAGQGTAALELLEDAPDLDALIAPVGGGGLLSGCAIIARTCAPRSVCSASNRPMATTHFSRSRPASAAPSRCPNTIADGLRAPQPGELTFPDHPATGRADSSGQRRRNPRSGKVPAHAAEDPGRTQRRGGRGRAAARQAAGWHR